MGKPLADARALDVPQTIPTFRHYAGWADKLTDLSIPTPGYQGRPKLSHTLRQPIGVVAAITSWNSPTMIASWKLAPALAVGCPVILKSAAPSPAPFAAPGGMPMTGSMDAPTLAPTLAPLLAVLLFAYAILLADRMRNRAGAACELVMSLAMGLMLVFGL